MTSVMAKKYNAFEYIGYVLFRVLFSNVKLEARASHTTFVAT